MPTRLRGFAAWRVFDSTGCLGTIWMFPAGGKNLGLEEGRMENSDRPYQQKRQAIRKIFDGQIMSRRHSITELRTQAESDAREDRIFQQRRALERGDREGFILATGYWPGLYVPPYGGENRRETTTERKLREWKEKQDARRVPK